MDKNIKKTGRLRRMLFGMMGPTLARSVIAFILRRKIDKSQARLPGDLDRSSDILFILPEGRIEMVFLLETLFTIIRRFKESRLTFICPKAHATFVSALKGGHVLAYDPDGFSLYSSEFHKLTGELASRAFDLCILLERQYTLAHLYLVGMSRAHLRLGWGDANQYPFLNVRIVPGDSDTISIWEQNSGMAKLLGIDTDDTTVHWGVQESTKEEVTQLLCEFKLKKGNRLICIDIANLENSCGREWCSQFLKSLTGQSFGQIYIFSGTEEEHSLHKGMAFPALPPMSTSRTAALLAMTDLVVTGVGTLLGLAQISECDIIPVLSEDDANFYCKKSARIMPVTFDSEPGENEVKSVLKNIKALTASGDGNKS